MKKFLSIFTAISLIVAMTTTLCFAAAPSAYSFAGINGKNVSYVTIDMNNANMVPVVMTAGSDLSSAESVASMAGRYGAFAAINGTYFSAYNGNPVSWGTIIKGGKVLHISQGGSVAGFTQDGRLLIDRLTFDFAGYINGEYRSIPWRINHPSPEEGAITIFTPEYGKAVTVAAGALAPVVGADGKVSYIANAGFYVPAGGFAIVYNPAVANLVTERFKVGDEVTYDVTINTTFTSPEDWDGVMTAVGAGPSLLINGQVTADPVAELFTEAKITTQAGGRSFVGADAAGKVVIGTVGSATVAQMATICQSMGLVNAMCLDGGGSCGLYYNKQISAGRAVNNALGFIDASGGKGLVSSGVNAIGRPQTITVDGTDVEIGAYNIGGNNFFKLRDVAAALIDTKAEFSVDYDNSTKAVTLQSGEKYVKSGNEFAAVKTGTITVNPTPSKIYVNGTQVKLTAYNIGGNNYFKLRDIGEVIDFGIDYDNATKKIIVDTEKEYTE